MIKFANFTGVSHACLDETIAAFDQNKLPLGFFTPAIAASQNLPHETVAVLAQDRTGRCLLSTRASLLLDITCYGALPASMGRAEYAVKLLESGPGHAAPARFIAKISAPPADINLFMAEYSPNMLNTLVNNDFSSIYKEELRELQEIGMLNPLLVLLLPHIA